MYFTAVIKTGISTIFSSSSSRFVSGASAVPKLPASSHPKHPPLPADRDREPGSFLSHSFRLCCSLTGRSDCRHHLLKCSPSLPAANLFLLSLIFSPSPHRNPSADSCPCIHSINRIICRTYVHYIGEAKRNQEESVNIISTVVLYFLVAC